MYHLRNYGSPLQKSKIATFIDTKLGAYEEIVGEHEFDQLKNTILVVGGKSASTVEIGLLDMFRVGKKGGYTPSHEIDYNDDDSDSIDDEITGADDEINIGNLQAIMDEEDDAIDELPFTGSFSDLFDSDIQVIMDEENNTIDELPFVGSFSDLYTGARDGTRDDVFNTIDENPIVGSFRDLYDDTQVVMDEEFNTIDEVPFVGSFSELYDNDEQLDAYFMEDNVDHKDVSNMTNIL